MPLSPAGSAARLIVYGGELPALETALALRRQGGDRCRITLLSPVRDLPVRTQAIGAPGPSARFDLGALASELGLDFRSDAIAAVDDGRGELRTIGAARLGYDALVVASGARPRAGVAGARTFWGAADTAAFEGLLADLRSGSVRRMAFAVPSSSRWSAPTYELALSTAHRARIEGLDAELVLVTHEERPLEVLGEAATSLVKKRLSDAQIALVSGVEPVSFEDRSLALVPEGSVQADAAIALSVIEGPRIAGLPSDGGGFLPVDDYGRVSGCARVWAAGDVTPFPVREPGIAAQQGRSVAASIAAELGAEVDAVPFRPVLRGRLNVGTPPGARGSNGSGPPPPILWWPTEQLAGEHLTAHIASKLAVEPPGEEGSIPFAIELSHDGGLVAGRPA